MFFVSLNFYIMTNGNGNTIIAKVFFLNHSFISRDTITDIEFPKKRLSHSNNTLPLCFEYAVKNPQTSAFSDAFFALILV